MTLTAGLLEHLSPEARRKTLTFVAIGTVCTLTYLALYAALRSAMAADTANVVAQLVTTVMSTAGNRRFTMQVTGGHRAMRHHVEMVGVFVLGLVINAMALDLLAQAAPNTGSVAEMVVLLVSGGIATTIKVALMSRWKTADTTPSVLGGTMDHDDTPTLGGTVAVLDPARRPGSVPGRRGGSPAPGAHRPTAGGRWGRGPHPRPAGRRQRLVRGTGVRGARGYAVAGGGPEVS